MVHSGCLGIDLGTTFSSFSIYNDNRSEILENEEGERVIPSVVGFEGDEILYGNEAVDEVEFHERLVYDVKRMIGSRYSEVSNLVPRLAYKVVNEAGLPKIRVPQENGEELSFMPKEISGKFLTYIKECAAEALDEDINKAVVTVPAHFTDPQRSATKEAGSEAGLNVIEVLSEPVAAALNFANELEAKKAENVLVFDFGGGTLDVTVLSLNPEEGKFDVKGLDGNMRLGGRDFDQKIVEHCLQVFQENTGEDSSQDKRALSILKKKASTAKIMLTERTSFTMKASKLFNNKNLEFTLTRAKFDEICQDLYNQVLNPVESAISFAKMEPKDIDQVIMVGGTSWIPKVKDILRTYFDKEPFFVDPQVAIAKGAASYAASIGPRKNDERLKLPSYLPQEILPFSLGVETQGGKMSPILERMTPFPCSETREFRPVVDYQDYVEIEVYQGNRVLVHDNTRLGVFKLSNLPKKKRKETVISVTFSVDRSCIMTVEAACEGSSEAITITRTQDALESIEDSSLDEEEIEEDRANLEKHRAMMESSSKISMDICFAMDCTGSMGLWIEAGKEKITKLVQSIESMIKDRFSDYETNIRVSFVGYRDHNDTNRIQKMPFTEDTDGVCRFVGTMDATGGGDAPEDITGAYQEALELPWEAEHRFLVHIADAPCHGTKYHDLGRSCDNNADGCPENLKPEDQLEVMKSKNINLLFTKITEHTDKMIDVFSKVYNDSKFNLEILDLTSEDTSLFIPKISSAITKMTLAEL
eukprot:gb/GECH01010873.1/.p1 GENE.gb/GECH01010873.1/~~gb/GECH01010873.1/.p1  ORF type:complete len:759 (+),score=129.85 gb/GECH01010873.1/:1-2277(+)